MLNSETLEVAIGMAFLFLLMSIICTAVKEWLEGMLKWRAMDLERALRTLLDDNDGTVHRLPVPPPGHRFAVPGPLRPGASARQVAHLRQERALHALEPAPQPAPPTFRPRTSRPPFSTWVARGPVSDSGSDDQGATSYRFTIQSLRERAAALASPHLRRAVLSAIDHSGGDIERLRLNIQRWFDGTMDRASGWYKRRTQTVLFVLGLAVAGVLNVDALHIMERLTADKTFRDAVVKEASAARPPDESASATARIRATRQEIQDVGMPVGWGERRAARLAGARDRSRATLRGAAARGVQPAQGRIAPAGPDRAGLADHRLRGHARRALLVRRAQQVHGNPLDRQAARKEPRGRIAGSHRQGRRGCRCDGAGDRGGARRGRAGRGLLRRQMLPRPGAGPPSPAPAPAPGPAPPAFVAHAWRPGFANPGEGGAVSAGSNDSVLMVNRDFSLLAPQFAAAREGGDRRMQRGRQGRPARDGLRGLPVAAAAGALLPARTHHHPRRSSP